ncbi:MBL fold metallo-hydrolase [Myxococcota bacterium]|nr:MBL fold metallo-hydrolase [Myxococcota bacterium]
MAFEIWVVGVGDAFSVRHFGTSFLLRRGDFVCGVDCPDLYRRALHTHRFQHQGDLLDAQHLDALILTHLHGDHVNGLEMVAAYLRFGFRKKLKLYTSKEVIQDLWDRRLSVSLGQMWDGQRYQKLSVEDYFDLEEIPWQVPVQIGPFTVTTRRTIHHLPTMALQISDGEHTFGHSCDTAYDPDLIDWLQRCDLFFHEANFGPAHTPLERLQSLPLEIRKKMRLVHYSDLLDLSTLQGIQPASEGQHIVVGSDESIGLM